MPTVKEVYATSTTLCEDFMDSTEGKEFLEEMEKKFPKLKHGGKETKQALQLIIEKIGDWLYSHPSEFNEIDIQAFVDTNHESLHEALYDKIT